MVMRAPQTAARKGIVHREAIALWTEVFFLKKERKKTKTPTEGWEDDGTPPPHRG